MIKNYILTAANVLIAGWFLCLMFDPAFYLFYLTIAMLFLALLCWNAVGELLVVYIVFRARRMPVDALIAPVLQEYLTSETTNRNLLEEGCTVYYADSKVPFFLPVSRRRAVISLALENALIEYGAGVLRRGVPPETYIPQILFSRRLLLLAILVDSIMLRVMELLTIALAFLTRILFAFIVAIVTGAIFDNPKAIWNSLSIGYFLGAVVVKINDAYNYVQDKIIEWLMKGIKAYSFAFITEDNAVRHGY